MAENDDEQARSSGTGVGASLARPGGLSYLEIPALDARRSAAFYEKVLGWNLRGPDTDDPRFVVRRVDLSNSPGTRVGAVNRAGGGPLSSCPCGPSPQRDVEAMSRRAQERGERSPVRRERVRRE
jgi:predicted enzyme related to lactoylglutathione lyase